MGAQVSVALTCSSMPSMPLPGKSRIPNCTNALLDTSATVRGQKSSNKAGASFPFDDTSAVLVSHRVSCGDILLKMTFLMLVLPALQGVSAHAASRQRPLARSHAAREIDEPCARTLLGPSAGCAAMTWAPSSGQHPGREFCTVRSALCCGAIGRGDGEVGSGPRAFPADSSQCREQPRACTQHAQQQHPARLEYASP